MNAIESNNFFMYRGAIVDVESMLVAYRGSLREKAMGLCWKTFRSDFFERFEANLSGWPTLTHNARHSANGGTSKNGSFAVIVRAEDFEAAQWVADRATEAAFDGASERVKRQVDCGERLFVARHKVQASCINATHATLARQRRNNFPLWLVFVEYPNHI